MTGAAGTDNAIKYNARDAHLPSDFRGERRKGCAVVAAGRRPVIPDGESKPLRLPAEVVPVNHHHHAHHTPQDRGGRAMAVTLVLVTVYMLAEVVGGLLSGSLALLADAGHMLSDAAALALALFAQRLASREAGSPQLTFGYHRAEVLVALVNGATLLTIAVLIVVEALERLGTPALVQGPLMLAVAAGGLLVNGIGLLMLHGAKDVSINVRGAWLHVLGDTLGSLQAVIAGALIWAYGWYWADPLASLLIALLIVRSTWLLMKETVGVLMETAPAHVDVEAVGAGLVAIDDVVRVHDLHVWTVTTGFESTTVHLVTQGRRDCFEVLADARRILAERFGLRHVTVQVEREGDGTEAGCDSASCGQANAG